MLEDMTVPDVAKLCSRSHRCPSREVEFGDDACHLSWKCLHRVLPGRPFIGRRCDWGSGKNQLRRILLIVEGLPVENLELYQVKMNGVRILGGVDQVPHFDR